MPQHTAVQRISSEGEHPRRSPRLQQLAFRLKEKSKLPPISCRSLPLAALASRPKLKPIQQQQQQRRQTEPRPHRIPKRRLRPLVLILRQTPRTDEEFFRQIFDSKGFHRGAGLNIIFPEEYEDPLKELNMPNTERVSSGQDSAYWKKYGKQASVVINGHRVECLRWCLCLVLRLSSVGIVEYLALHLPPTFLRFLPTAQSNWPSISTQRRSKS